MNKSYFQLSSTNWQQVNDLLADALECPPDERKTFLKKSCGANEDLYLEVTSLLEAYTAADDFLVQINAAEVAALLSETKELETGREFGSYRIIRPLGRGGMGIVYLAEDTRLNRKIALKFLPLHLARDEAAELRLFAEARAAASLDHPNIAIVHEVAKTNDDQPFIAMAYYEGDTLQQKISRGPLQIKEAENLAIQIAKGLNAAHEQDIVHRDIKPSNILVTKDGVAKIVDFGIAKLMGSELTKTGATLGTVAYMSPEQTRGEAVNAQTDIWSLGVVLYEMLTGSRPFVGNNDQTVIFAIRNDEPQPIEHLRTEIPAHLARVIERCLEKDGTQRYPKVEVLLADLRETDFPHITQKPGFVGVRRSVAALLGILLLGALYFIPSLSQKEDVIAGINRIVVLPLENVGPETDDAYFAAGLTEELTSRISKLSGLRVIGRTSARQYAGKDRNIAEIRKAMDVSAVLEGSVRKEENEFRITLQLIDTESEALLWSEIYDSEAKDVLTVQSKIAEQVAEALDIQMNRGERERVTGQGTKDLMAYEHYLKGRYNLKKWTETSIVQARDHFQSALDLDPTFAQAWAGLADAFKILDYLAVLPPAEASSRARAAAERALSLNPELAEAHASLATVLSEYYRDQRAAGQHFETAITLSPGYATGHQLYAEYLRDMGRFEEAMKEIKLAIELDPLSPFYLMIEGLVLYESRRFDESIEHYLKLLDIYPDYLAVHTYLGLAYAETGQYQEALDGLDKIDPQHSNPEQLSIRGIVLARMGENYKANKILEKLDTISEQRYVPPFTKSIIHAALGNQDLAFALLDQAYEERSWFMRLLKVEPKLDPLRSDPRFTALLEKMGLIE